MAATEDGAGPRSAWQSFSVLVCRVMSCVRVSETVSLLWVRQSNTSRSATAFGRFGALFAEHRSSTVVCLFHASADWTTSAHGADGYVLDCLCCAATRHCCHTYDTVQTATCWTASPVLQLETAPCSPQSPSMPDARCPMQPCLRVILACARSMLPVCTHAMVSP